MRLTVVSLLVALVFAACGGAPVGPTQALGSPVAGGGAATPGGDAATPGGDGATPAGGGGGGPVAGAGQICQLLPAADVSQAAGKPATIAEDQSGETNCTYNIGPPDELIPDYVVDVRTETGDFTGPKAAFPGGQDITGLGEGAYWAPSVSVLWFMSGGQMYVIQLVLFGEDDGDPLQVAQQIARSLIGRL